MKPMVGKPALSAFLSDDSITGNHGVLEIHGELCNARCLVALGQSATSQLNAPVAGSGLVLPSLLNINLFYASIYLLPPSVLRESGRLQHSVNRNYFSLLGALTLGQSLLCSRMLREVDAGLPSLSCSDVLSRSRGWC